MRHILLAIMLVGLAGSAFASNNINNLPALTQGQFHDLSADLGAVLTFKQLQSAEAEGITGFDLGLDLSSTNVAHAAAWNTATSGSGVTTIPMARVSLSKGLPFGFDIGGFYSGATNSNIKDYGAELRYALVDDGVFTPAVGLRAAFSKLTGVSQLSFQTKSLSLSVSKSLGPFIPYAGIGRVWINSNPDAATGLQDENFTADESFVGLAFEFGVHLALELNRTAGNNTYSVKLGFGF
ncbi:MAG: hypothetical protein KGL00_04755 [Gammaproteobacteria bacterium]|nr:hypothetical protein [Gammaproteobacteria bacterium]MDE2024566.1 hypothetical protein [Gammaproteobacteria bacterium]MDE2139540.1 hypothetical protein [Gammaproteobacteria bacterium]MDE2273487.1 hypothetical protein [Gammaproteobacteria bacterium]